MIQENISPDFLDEYAGTYQPELSDHDCASMVLCNLDYDAQLREIRHLLDRNRDDDATLQAEIRREEEHITQTRGLLNDRCIAHWIDLLNASVYRDAAHSMAAVGMFAPFLEALFCSAFAGIHEHLGKLYDQNPPNTHMRWQAADTSMWNCKLKFKKNGKYKPDICAGIQQLAEAVGLADSLPSDLWQMMRALFDYRNMMFHNGFEWPEKELNTFNSRLNDISKEWFKTMQSGKDKDHLKPWFFYLSDAFIQHCLEKSEGVIAGIGVFCKKMSGRPEWR
jgi:hypothetical protein